jgi:hypothetical protein
MAVRHGYGKIAGADALVFAYDTGDTRNSYRGEPTTNYTTDSGILQNGWSGGFSLLDSSTKSFQLNVSNFHTDNRGWRSFMWDMRAHAGSAVTISATVEVPSDSPGDFAWVMIGQANTRDSGTTTATYLGYSSASERYQKSTSNTERITWSGIVGNTGTANQPNGIIGFTVWYNGGTIGTNSFIKVSNVQIELKSHATQFVNGTRSVSGSLFDLTGNTTLNLADAAFDLDTQMTFDGTDTKVPITGLTISATQNKSYEAVIKLATGYNQIGIIIGGRSNSTNAFGVQAGRELRGSEDDEYIIGSSLNVDEWYHVAYTFEFDGTSAFQKLYINGELDTERTKTTYIDTYVESTQHIGYEHRFDYRFNGDIPVCKVYNKTLTAAEVQSNYRHYKQRFNL